MDKENRVPPIIQDYIATINNTRNPLHVRENARLMLENIITACTKAVSDFKFKNSRRT